MRESLVGKTFGRLVVKSYSHKNKYGALYWNCTCSCHQQKIVSGGNLRTGNNRSCGCLQKELASKRATTHGMKGTVTYRSWNNMKSRCYDLKNISYPWYGGRGISVCDRWRNSFENFYFDMGVKPQDLTLDRINNNGNYTPENCKWSTILEQSNNTQRSVWITIDNEKHTIAEWARIKNVGCHMIQQRISRFGWTSEQAVMVPPRRSADKTKMFGNK